ncbi:MAG TPA: RIP metalloprotease RseP [bacterium]|nr:RIP metalloprotease RseP [bacterium]
MSVLYFLILISILVLIHEYGHYIQAKLNGVKVYEFSIGFGPKAFSFERNGTMFSVRFLPIGGYVKLAGLDTDEPVEDELNFNKKSWFSKFLILASGGIMNFLLAILILFILFVWGVPTVVPTGINTVLPGSPAEMAGIKPGDRIISVNGKEVTLSEEITQAIQSSKDKVILEIERGGERLTIELTPKYDEVQKRNLIGITIPAFTDVRYPVGEAFIMSLKEFSTIIVGTLEAFGGLITGKLGSEAISGPIGVARITGAAAQMGIKVFLQLMAFLSIQLGLFNLLPIPALDGGRIFFLILNLGKKIKISPEKENLVHYIGFLVLLILMIIVTIGDVSRF